MFDFLRKLRLPGGGIETPLSPALISMGSRALDVISSITPGAWFGPGQPLKPVAPADTLPRAFDYPFGSNLWVEPRDEQPGRAAFHQLRAFADNCDLLRLVIETRKDQIAKMPWVWQIDREPGEKTHKYNERVATDPRVRYLNEFFRRPDREHKFADWIRMALEEVFVIDALSIWPVHDKGSKNVVSLNLIDGATIKPLHTTEGWRPQPPDPAYQQIIKGMPALDLTTDQLVYSPRNPRVHMFYGYSPVEQILMTINLAIHRQLSQLQYYTDGNVPEMIVSAPEGWTPAQIKEFQEWLDTMVGQQELRRTVRMFPSARDIHETKDRVLSDKLDEWLARVVCYAFSVPPTPFVHMMNRATSNQLADSAMEEGLLPLLNWISDELTFIARYHMGIDGVTCICNPSADTDRKVQSDIDCNEIKIGRRGIDEVRERDGEEPFGVPPFVMTAQGPILLSDIGKAPPAAPAANGDASSLTDEEQTEKLRKLLARRRPVNGRQALKLLAPAPVPLLKAAKLLPPTIQPWKLLRDSRPAKKDLKKALKNLFAAQRAAAVKVLVAYTPAEKLAKASIGQEALLKALLKAIDAESAGLPPDARQALETAAQAGAAKGFADFDVSDADMINPVNQTAADWAEKRAAEIVGMKWKDGELVANPRAEMAISDTTRSELRGIVTDAFKAETPMPDLIEQIQEAGCFSDDRAALIAQTETSRAQTQGNLDAWEATGLVQEIEWLNSEDEGVCEECEDLADGGPYPIEDAPMPVDDSHPGCRCTARAVLAAGGNDDE
jgi:SPP1 gp7 family putative phage head morphogenesis protein